MPRGRLLDAAACADSSVMVAGRQALAFGMQGLGFADVLVSLAGQTHLL